MKKIKHLIHRLVMAIKQHQPISGCLTTIFSYLPTATIIRFNSKLLREAHIKKIARTITESDGGEPISFSVGPAYVGSIDLHATIEKLAADRSATGVQGELDIQGSKITIERGIKAKNNSQINEKGYAYEDQKN